MDAGRNFAEFEQLGYPAEQFRPHPSAAKAAASVFRYVEPDTLDWYAFFRLSTRTAFSGRAPGACFGKPLSADGLD